MTTATSERQPCALPRALRLPAAAAMCLATLLFAGLAARYAGSAQPGRLDTRAEQLIDILPNQDAHLFTMVVWIGNPLATVALALAGLALSVGRRRLALLAVLGPGLTGLATTALKPVIGRLLNGEFAFPSGHTGAATALSIVAALLLVETLQLRRAAGTILVGLTALLSAGVMAVGLTILAYHYPTDTIGGFCVALVVVLGSAWLIDTIADRTVTQTVT